MPEERSMEELLADRVRALEERFPGLTARFCRIMGRRISHLAGNPSVTGGGSLRVEVLPSLLLMVDGDLLGREEELEEFVSHTAGDEDLVREFSG